MFDQFMKVTFHLSHKKMFEPFQLTCLTCRIEESLMLQCVVFEENTQEENN